MKITFLVSGTIRSNFSYRILALASALQKRGHTVSIIAPTADKYNNFIPEQISTLNGVTIRQPFQYKTKSSLINLLPYIISASYITLKEKADLVYIYKPTPITIVGLLAKIFHRIPVVLDMDDLGSEVMKIEGHLLYQQLLVRWCEKITAAYADKIIVASTFLFDLYKSQFPKKPIHIMSNGVDEEWFSKTLSSFSKKRIIFMGAINRKNILEPLFEVLPSVLKKYSTLEVLIIGDGKYLDYFKDKAKALSINTSITFTGWLSLSQIREQLHFADIGYNYMPHERTTLAANNMKIPQYMSRGMVPIVSDIGDMPASVAHGRAGYIAKADTATSLEQTIYDALEDKDINEKARSARLFSENQFDWNILAERVETFLFGRKNTLSNKKVYVVSTAFPANTGGANIRNLNLIKQLKKTKNINMKLFSVASKEVEAEQAALMRELGITVHLVKRASRNIFSIIWAILFKRVPPYMTEYAQSDLGKIFYNACLQSLPDVVQVEQLTAYYAIKPYLSVLRQKGVTIIFDTHNVEAELFKNLIKIFSPFKRIAGKLVLSHLRTIEMKALRESTVVIACSKHDADYFTQYNKNVYVLPNGVDCERFTPAPKKKNILKLLFIGGTEYPPNADAIRYYLGSIHPHIKKIVPNVEVLLIGATPEWLTKEGYGGDNSITGLGFVESITPYLEEATLGICTVRYGSGTRLKVLTYMAAGLPVISTTKGAEGIEYTNSSNILIADTAEDFTRQVLDIFRNHVQYEAISQSARAFVLQAYDWNVIGKMLLAMYTHYGIN